MFYKSTFSPSLVIEFTYFSTFNSREILFSGIFSVVGLCINISTPSSDSELYDWDEEEFLDLGKVFLSFFLFSIEFKFKLFYL